MLNTGVNSTTEIGVRTWSSLFSYGGKAYFKYRLSQPEQTPVVSIQPGFVFSGENTNSSSTNNDTNRHDARYRSEGLELPLLVTWRANAHLAATVSGRINYNTYSYQYDSNSELIKRGPFDIMHGGINGNLQFRLKPFNLTPEVSMEIVPIKHGSISVLPGASLGIGLEF